MTTAASRMRGAEEFELPEGGWYGGVVVNARARALSAKTTTSQPQAQPKKKVVNSLVPRIWVLQRCQRARFSYGFS